MIDQQCSFHPWCHCKLNRVACHLQRPLNSIHSASLILAYDQVQEIAFLLEAILRKMLNSRLRTVDIFSNIGFKEGSSAIESIRLIALCSHFLHEDALIFRFYKALSHIKMSARISVNCNLFYIAVRLITHVLKHSGIKECFLKALNTQTRDWQTKGSVGCKPSVEECFLCSQHTVTKWDIFRTNWIMKCQVRNLLLEWRHE